MLVLRDYQGDGVNEIRESLKAGKSSPLFVLPTGGGKTVIFCHIAHKTSDKNKNVLVLVHRVELLRQTSKALTKSGVHHGLINPKYTQDYSKSVQVASVQTLVNRLDKIPAPDLIIIDEAHHATAGSWRKVIEAFPRAKVLGVTATPCRGDGSGLGVESGGVFDDLIIGAQISDLINRGFLVEPVVYAPPSQLDLSAIRIVRGDYDSKQVEKAIDKPKIIGDTVAHYRKLCHGAPAVAFCASIKHAEHVADAFREAGYRAYSVDGSMDDGTRSRILDGLGNGTVDIVTSCDLISEGTDIPAIGCAILLRPTQSLGLYIQQVGRALRPSPGKKEAIILDHVGNVLQHGMPDDIREWDLSAKKRKGRSKASEASIQIVQCESCYQVFKPADVCPACGEPVKRKIKEMPDQVDGELTKIDKDQIKMQRVRLVSNARTLEELKEVGKQLGYKRGWAEHVFNSRQRKII